MKKYWLISSLFGVALGTTAACGSSNDGTIAAGGDGSSGSSAGNSQGATNANGGSNAGGGTTSSAGGGTRSDGGSLNAGGAQNVGGAQNNGGTSAGGSKNAGGESPGGSEAGGSEAMGGLGMGGSISTPPPATFPLLVATTSTKVSVWEHADAVKTDDPPSFELPIALGAWGAILGVVATRERLGVVSTSGLFLFDDLGKLSPSSKPSATIPPEAFSSDLLGTFNQQVVDADGDLWLTYGSGRVALFKSFNALTSASKPKAEFTHKWEQLASSAYYAPADILFVPQVSGAGLLYYSKAKTKTGITAPDGAFDKFSGWQSAILGDSLFAAADKLAAWHGLAAASAPRGPDATLSSSGLYLDASADAVAIADSDGNVSYFSSASSLASGAKPDTLKVTPFVYGLDLSQDAKTVATVANKEVSVITHAAAGLKLQAKLALSDGQGNDVTIVE